MEACSKVLHLILGSWTLFALPECALQFFVLRFTALEICVVNDCGLFVSKVN